MKWLGLIIFAQSIAAANLQTRTTRPLLEATGAEIATLRQNPTAKACARPGLYEYLRQQGQISGPPIDDLCPSFRLLTERGEYLELPFARLQQAQYVIAGRGDGMASRFGHALIRLTFCRPGEVAPCQADDFYAVDVGFAAQTQNLKFSALGGITGRYPSLLSVAADSDLRLRYLHDELRSLNAYPLKFERDRLRLLWVMIVEKFWIHSAHYRFLSNNCADEVVNLLVSITPDQPNLGEISRTFLTPAGLLKSLRTLKLVDQELIWNSQRALLEQQLMRIIGHTDHLVGDLKSYQKEPAINRHAWIAPLNDPYDRQIMARFEEITAKKLSLKVTQDAVKTLYIDNTSPRCAESREELIARLEENTRAVTPQALKQSASNEVPPLTRLPTSEQITRQRATLNQTLNHIVACYKEQILVKRDLNEARTSFANLNDLRNGVRQ